VNQPAPLPHSIPQAEGSEQNLWDHASGWRTLTIAASFLTFSAVALLTLLPQPQTALVKHVSAAVSGAPVSPSAPTPIAPGDVAAPLATPVRIAKLSRHSPAQTPMSGAPACALHQPASPLPMGLGTIIALQDPVLSLADIPRREARLGGSIDPDYVHDLRAVVRQDDGRIQAFDVPRGMTVQVGDRITLQDSYRSTALPCSYIPILITANLGPPATPTQAPHE
jgi:hypothetical protein